MLKKLILAMAVLGLTLGAGMASAQDWGFRMGDFELTMQGSGSSDDELDNTVLSVEAGLGYFMSDALELGVRQGIGFVDIEGGDDDWSGSTRGFLDLHFGIGGLYPFIGVNFGYLYGDNVNETWIAGPEIGIKGFVSETAFIYGLVEYNVTFDDADEVDENFDDGRFVYALGLGVRL
ncbi:MAG: hypothetical protein R6U50_18630 [Desulfobacterales bacterium]